MDRKNSRGLEEPKSNYIKKLKIFLKSLNQLEKISRKKKIETSVRKI